jgi:O-antigen/teichoic acid export membrane protein
MYGQIGHVLWGRVGMAASRVAALMVLARQLGPEDLGRFSFIIIVFVVFSTMTSLGITVSGPVLVAERGEDGRRLLLPMLAQAAACFVGSYLLLAVIRGCFSSRLFEGFTAPSLDLLGLSLLAGHVNLCLRAYLAGRERFAQVSILTVVQWGGYLAAVSIASAVRTVDLSLAVVCFAVPVWLSAFLAALLAARDGRIEFRRGDSRQLFSLGWRSQLAQILNLLQMRLDMLLLRVLTSADQLGYYSVATNLSEWMLYLPRAFQQVAVPRSARRSDVPAWVYGWLFVVLGLTSLGVAAAAPLLVRIFFGSEYDAAIPVVRVILPGTVMLGLGTLAQGTLFGRKETRYLSATGAVVAAGFLVFDLLTVPHSGAFGAAAVSSVLYSVYSLFLVRRVFAGDPLGLADYFRRPAAGRRPRA